MASRTLEMKESLVSWFVTKVMVALTGVARETLVFLCGSSNY